MRDRRRLAVVAAVAVVVLVVAELGVRLREPALLEPRRWSGPEMPLKEDAIDDLAASGGASIVFLGSSNVDVAFDASSIDASVDGRPAYNAALGASSIGMISTWTQLVVVPRLHPDVVVLGLTSRELNPHDPEQRRHEREFLEAPAMARLLGTESLLERTERHLEDVSGLLRYRASLRTPRDVLAALGLVQRPPDRTFGSVVASDGQYEGFLDVSYQFGPAMAANFRERSLFRWETGRAELATLQDLLDHLTGTGAEVVLLDMPVTADYVALHPRGEADYEAYRATVRGVAADAGVTFVEPGVWDEALFADPGHLNRAGASRLTRLIDETLSRPVG